MARVVLEEAERDVLDALMAVTFKRRKVSERRIDAMAREVADHLGEPYGNVEGILWLLKRVKLVDDHEVEGVVRWYVTSEGVAWRDES